MTLLRSIGYRLFFFVLTGLGLSLSYWQYRRAIRVELLEGGQVVALRNSLAISQIWLYEKPDRAEGRIYEVSDRFSKKYCVFQEDYENQGEYRSVKWSLPPWCDRQNLRNAETGEVIKTLSELLKSYGDQGDFMQLLKPVWSKVEIKKRQGRHYAYALQWLALAIASSYYGLWAKIRSS